MERVDWFFVITDLQRVGVYPETIARHINRTRGTVQNFKNVDTEPRHCDGQKILELWRNATGKNDPPMVNMIRI